jgi:cytochrome c oxidase subunit II
MRAGRQVFEAFRGHSPGRSSKTPPRPRSRRALALVVPLLLLLSACASDAPQDTLDPAGPIARKIDNLVNPVFIVAAVVFVLVEFGVLYLVLKFRQRKDDDPDELPGQTHGNTKLEIGWTVLPALLLGFVAFATLATLFDINDTKDDGLTVQVTGQQWWWEFTYDTDGDGDFTDEDVLTANDLVIPAGQNVGLEVTSRDVIHSFWVPRLNGKKDAVPGRRHPLTINADEPGTYVGQCTEFCGLSHAYMRQRVVALPEDEFEAWLDDQQAEADEPTDEAAAAGAELFASQCSVCHLARGINDDQFEDAGDGTTELVSENAPDLTHFGTRGAFAGATFNLWDDLDGDHIVEADEIGTANGGVLNRAALEAWLRDPPAEKPMDPVTPEQVEAGQQGRGMPNLNLSEEQIDQLVAFLETLQ